MLTFDANKKSLRIFCKHSAQCGVQLAIATKSWYCEGEELLWPNGKQSRHSKRVRHFFPCSWHHSFSHKSHKCAPRSIARYIMPFTLAHGRARARVHKLLMLQSTYWSCRMYSLRRNYNSRNNSQRIRIHSCPHAACLRQIECFAAPKKKATEYGTVRGALFQWQSRAGNNVHTLHRRQRGIDAVAAAADSVDAFVWRAIKFALEIETFPHSTMTSNNWGWTKWPKRRQHEYEGKKNFAVVC